MGSCFGSFQPIWTIQVRIRKSISLIFLEKNSRGPNNFSIGNDSDEQGPILRNYTREDSFHFIFVTNSF